MSQFILTGTNDGTPLRFEIAQGTNVVGRAPDCDILIHDPLISRRHAEVILEDEDVWVHDLESLNGNFVDGTRVREKARLPLRSTVKFGRISLTLIEAQSSNVIPVATDDGAFDTLTTSIGEIRNQERKTQSERILTAMAEAGQLLSRSMALPDLYERFFDLLDRVLSNSRILIIMTNPGTGECVVEASRVHDTAPEESLKISEAMLAEIVEEGRAILTADASSDRKWNSRESINALGVRAAIGAPLFDNDKVLGAIYMDSRMIGVAYQMEDLQLLTILANMVAVKITNHRLEEEERKLAKIKNDLNTAAKIQRNLLPRTLPEVSGYEFFAYLDACDEIGGDLYDVRRCRDGRFWLVVGDVTDHGIIAALLMSHVMAGLQILEDGCGDPVEMVTKLDAFMANHMEIGQFVTMFVGLLDPVSGRMEYVNAGHVPPVLFHKGARQLLHSSGPPVAILPGPVSRTRAECILGPGSSLLVYSDGVSEMGHESRKLYGEGSMQAYLGGAHDLGAEGLVRGLLNDAMEFSNGEPADDDLTLLAIRRD